MDHELLGEVFRAAGDYHAALAQYAAKMRERADIESAAQAVVGASLHYRVALDNLEKGDPETLAFIARGGRLERLRKILATTSHRYNVFKQRPPAGVPWREWVTSVR